MALNAGQPKLVLDPGAERSTVPWSMVDVAKREEIEALKREQAKSPIEIIGRYRTTS